MALKIYFRHEINDLIDLVKERPCIWDKTTEEYKDKVLREQAWREIFCGLETNYEKFEEDDKRKTARAITEKWKHIKDAFIRSLKKKSLHASTKTYLYADQLQFLRRMVEKDETESSFSERSQQHLEDEDTGDENPVQSHRQRSPQPKIRKKTLSDQVDRALLRALTQSQCATPPPPLDEDEAFFASLLPSVRSLTEDEKFDFRIGAMNLVQKIKQKRRAM